MKLLQDKLSVVTGASRGIGADIARTIAAHGSNVVINYSSNRDKAQALADSIESEFEVKTLVLGFNVSEEKEVESAFSEIAEKMGSVDILVNNAGVAIDGLLLRAKIEDIEKTLKINLIGSILCAKAVLKPMMKARKGRIINMSSVIGEMGNAGQSIYAASKAGILGFTKSLAKEVGSRGITVNAITPGFIKTDMTSGMGEDQVKALLASTALGRLGETADISNTVVYLASDWASYVTGQTIAVNGGLHSS